jgi:iron complex outermembrane receptor protein
MFKVGQILAYKEAERIQFQNLLPIDINRSKNESSVGGNWDINYRTNIGDVGISFNHLFYYTRLNKSLVLVGAPGGKIQFQNSTGYIDTKGVETNLRFLFGDFKMVYWIHLYRCQHTFYK